MVLQKLEIISKAQLLFPIIIFRLNEIKRREKYIFF